MTNGDWRKQMDERLNSRLRNQLLRQDTLDLCYEDTRWLLIDLLDKESQMSPTSGWSGYTCSSCAGFVGYLNDYCNRCGQKLGWRKDKC